MPWERVSSSAEVLAVHAAYMGFGQILYFGGDEFDREHNENSDFNDAARLFDCNDSTVRFVPSPHFDAFCCGHAFLGKARDEVQLVAAGGTERWEFPNRPSDFYHAHHFPGLRDAAVFHTPNFANPSGPGWVWEKAARMNPGLLRPTTPTEPELFSGRTGGRWYPTLTTLPNGDVIAFAGHPGSSDADHNNLIPEVFSPTPAPLGRWRRLADPFDPEQHDPYQLWGMILYPRMHLVETGDFIFTNRVHDDTFDVHDGTYSFRPFVGNGTFTKVCDWRPELDPFQGYDSTSVLLPIGRNRRGQFHNDFHAALLKCGGPGRQPYRLDLDNWDPEAPTPGAWGWRPTGRRQMQKRRKHANATILPTGEILVTGGIDAGADDADDIDAHGVREPEIYNTVFNEWRTVNEPSPIGMSPNGARNYHSVALLMPDGRVWSAGSSINHKSGVANANLDIDLFAPWYHGNPNRPEITAAPSWTKPQESIEIRSTFAEHIDRVVFVRCGSCTHAFNPDQRLIELEFEHTGGHELRVKMPPNNFIMPPGPYFIFTIRAWRRTPGLPSFGTDIFVRPSDQKD